MVRLSEHINLIKEISDNISDRNIEIMVDYSKRYGKIEFNKSLTKMLVTSRHHLIK